MVRKQGLVGLYFSSAVVLIKFTRSTRWLAEVGLGNSTRISWIRVIERSIAGRSAMLTDYTAVDLFQQYILKQGDQVRADGNLWSCTPSLKMIYRATSLLLSNSRTNKSHMRLGCPSSLSLVANCQSGSSHSMQWLQQPNRWSFMTRVFRPCKVTTQVVSNQMSTSERTVSLRRGTGRGDQFVLALSIIFAAISRRLYSKV